MPYFYRVAAKDGLADHDLLEEVFGPLGIVVAAADTDEMAKIARSIQGQLTCTIDVDDADMEQAQSLMPIIQRKAGRLLVNGFTTGVGVANCMVHGGPYPASTYFGATSVGTLSIQRLLRPVSYPNTPDTLLSKDF